MNNILLTIAYDGGNYRGWQKTKTGPSIEEELENVLTQILQEKIVLQAASRTDAGVHAHGQVVNFFTSRANLNLEKILVSLNQLLPKDIVVRNVENVPLDFHPTLHCKGKEYHYAICASNVQLPQNRHYSWHISSPLDFDKMKEAAKLLCGKQNFKALCNHKKNSRYKDYVRELTSIKIEILPDQRLIIKITGKNFLYKMARNIAGLIIYVGKGKIAPHEIATILASENRITAGVTAPAHGLTLHTVFF